MTSANILGWALFIGHDGGGPGRPANGYSVRYSPVLHIGRSCGCGNLLDLYDYKEAIYRKLHQREEDGDEDC
jgi:hypothetical protein